MLLNFMLNFCPVSYKAVSHNKKIRVYDQNPAISCKTRFLFIKRNACNSLQQY